jgi:hypothetical protein
MKVWLMQIWYVVSGERRANKLVAKALFKWDMGAGERRLDRLLREAFVKGFVEAFAEQLSIHFCYGDPLRDIAEILVTECEK